MLAVGGGSASDQHWVPKSARRARLRDGRMPAEIDPCPNRPNCVCSRRDALPGNRVAPIRVRGNPEAYFGRLKRVLANQPRTEIIAETDDYVHAACRTLMGFVDDLEARLSVSEGVIHVRSASRVGYYDLGVNRARVERLRRALHEAP